MAMLQLIFIPSVKQILSINSFCMLQRNFILILIFGLVLLTHSQSQTINNASIGNNGFWNRKCFQDPLTTSLSENLEGLQASIAQIISDSVVIRNGNLQMQVQGQTQFYYTVSLKGLAWDKDFQVVLGLSNAQFSQNNNGIQFMARTVSKPAFFYIILLMPSSNSWISSINVHYLVTARTDILVGNFYATNPQLLEQLQKTINNNQFKSMREEYYFKQSEYNNIKNSTNIKVLTFINGVKTSSKNLDIRVENSLVSIVNRTLTANVVVNNQKSPIWYVYLGYVIYVNYNSPFQVTQIKQIPGQVSKYRKVYNFLSVSRIQTVTSASIPFSSFSFYMGYFQPQQQKSTFKLLSSGISISANQFAQMPVVMQFEMMDSTQVPFMNPFSQFACVNYHQCKQLGGFNVVNESGQQSKKLCVLCTVNAAFDYLRGNCACVSGHSYNKDLRYCVSHQEMCGPEAKYFDGECYEKVKQKHEGSSIQ